MKLNGLVGKGSGRLGSSVFAVRGGEQIVRQYTPNVANPNTDRQKAQRAKFKLLSQLAAIASDGLLFAKEGNVSRRNAFVAANMPAVVYSSDIASLSMDAVKLGNGFAPVVITRTDHAEDNVSILELPDGGWDGIAYATVDFVEIGRVIGISGNVTGGQAEVPIIGTRMARTVIVAAAWRFRDGATRAKYTETITGTEGQSTYRLVVNVSDLVASGEVEVSQTVVAKAGA